MLECFLSMIFQIKLYEFKISTLIVTPKKALLFFILFPMFVVVLVRFVTIVWADFDFLPAARYFKLKGVGSFVLNLCFIFWCFLFFLKFLIVCVKTYFCLELLSFVNTFFSLFTYFVFITFFHWYSCLWRENDPMGDVAHRRRQIYNFFFFLFFFYSFIKLEYYQTFWIAFSFFIFYYAFIYDLVYTPRRYLESHLRFNLHRLFYVAVFSVTFSAFIIGAYGLD